MFPLLALLCPISWIAAFLIWVHFTYEANLVFFPTRVEFAYTTFEATTSFTLHWKKVIWRMACNGEPASFYTKWCRPALRIKLEHLAMYFVNAARRQGCEEVYPEFHTSGNWYLDILHFIPVTIEYTEVQGNTTFFLVSIAGHRVGVWYERHVS